MTNETTASQPKPPSGNRCPCDSSGTCQDVCPDPATGLPLCASADCYSARKPKSRSIGNDAQFWELMKEVIESLHSDALYRQARTALVAYIDSRVPAAQASATIQAAPLPAERTPNSSDPRDEAHAAGWNACLAAIRSVATIQEPVMVAEPVDDGLPPEVQKLFDQLRPEIDYWCTHRRESNLAALDAIEFRFKVSQARTVRLERAAKVAVSTTHAAPMVADPAGVALRTRYEKYMDWCQRSGYDALTWPEFVDSRINSGQRHHAPITYGIAATVKAVPSEALDSTQGEK